MGTEIIKAAATNRGLISSGLRAAHETLLGLGNGAKTYTADGAVAVGQTRSAVLDRSL
jgi:hypothetical protein